MAEKQKGCRRGTQGCKDLVVTVGIITEYAKKNNIRYRRCNRQLPENTNGHMEKSVHFVLT